MISYVTVAMCIVLVV